MSRLSKNIIYNVLGQGLLLILGFVAVKYVFSRLGADALGIIYFTTTLSAVLNAALEMGIGSTTVREVSAHFNDEPTYIRDLVRTASLFYWSAYGLLSVLIYFVAPVLVEDWINLRTVSEPAATRMVQILGVGMLSVLPRSLYGSLLRGLQRMEFNNLIELVTIGLQQFGIILILALGGGLFDVVKWLAASFVLGLLGYLLVCRHFLPVRDLLPGFSVSVVRRNLSYSLHMTVNSLISIVHQQCDRVIVSKLLPIGAFGFYACASSLVAKSALVTSAITQAGFPSFSALFHAGDRTGLLSQYRKLQDLLCFATLPVLAAIPFAAMPLFSYLFSPDTARTLLVPTMLLCLGSYMNGTLNVPYVISLAAGRPDIPVRSNFYALWVVIPSTVLVIWWFGLVGAGLSHVLYNLFSYGYAIPRICSQCLAIPTAGWYARVLKILALASVTYGAAGMILVSGGAHSILFLTLAYGGGSTLFLIGAYWMVGEELRGRLLRSMQVLRTRMAETL